MTALSLVSDADLIALMPSLVLGERARSADVIEHLVEIDRRRLFLDQACRSLSSYCIERLAYSEDEASKRVRVARLAKRFPRVLDELRAGAIHLTGLALLAQILTEENCATLLAQARGRSRRQVEQLIAAWFPKPDVPDRMCPVPEQTGSPALLADPGVPGADAANEIRPRTGVSADAERQPNQLEPLSASRWSVQFTASAGLHDKIERARELLSHAIPSGDLGALFERALDELIAHETKRRLGAGKSRKSRPLSPGSRHIPVEVARQVWERDGGQCTFVDEQGRRCSARHFITVEHRQPYAMGGLPTVDNTCLLCWAHNEHAAREVFGEAHIEAKRAERQKASEAERERHDAIAKAHKALRSMGFKEPQVRGALARLEQMEVAPGLEPLVRAALGLLVPDGKVKTVQAVGSGEVTDSPAAAEATAH
jgi:hypothetical protein